MIDRKDMKLYIYITGIILMLVIRDVLGITLNKYLFLLYISIWLFFMSYEYITYAMMFSIPLFCGLPAAHVRIIAIVLLLFRRKKLNYGQLFFCIFVTVMEIFATMWYPSFKLSDIIGYLSAPIMLFLYLWDENVLPETKISYEKCINLFIAGFFVVCGIIIMTAIIESPSNWVTKLVEGGFRDSVTEGDYSEGVSISMNANTLAYFCCVTSALCLAMKDYKNINTNSNSQNTLIYYILAIFFALVGLLTLSRTFVLALFILIILYVFSMLKSIKGIIYGLITIGGIFILGYILVNQVSGLTESILVRFSGADTATGGGRMELFIAYIDKFTSNLRFMFMGTGVVEYKAMTNIWNSIHNGTEQILVCMGIPGFLIYLIGLFNPLMKERHKTKIPTVYWLPIFMVLLFVQTIQFLNPTILMFPFLIGLYSLRLYTKRNV